VSQVGAAAGGTNRVDNFRVDAAVIPEPGAVLFGVLVCGVVGLTAAGRRLLAGK
jgi:hypothetical protein